MPHSPGCCTHEWTASPWAAGPCPAWLLPRTAPRAAQGRLATRLLSLAEAPNNLRSATWRTPATLAPRLTPQMAHYSFTCIGPPPAALEPSAAPYFQPTRSPLQSHPTFLLSPAHWETDGYGGENKGASPGASRSASVSPYGKGEGAGQEDLSCRCSPRCQAHPPSLLCWPQAAPKGHRPLAEPLVLPAGRPVSAAHGCGRKGGDVWTGMCPPTLSP